MNPAPATSSTAPAPAPAPPILEIRDLVKHFPVRGGVLNTVQGHVHAVNGVSFDVARGETLGIVGESGCGKSTLGKLIIRLIEPTSGSIRLDSQELAGLGHRSLMPMRRRVQMVFQDPYSSLNPRLTVRQLLTEVLAFHKIVPPARREARVAELLNKVGLRPDAADKFPHEFSGGQRQRLGIARALAVEPEIIIADEPVSALDVSIQAQVLNLLMDLKDDLGLTMIFVSHDLKVIEHFCDRVLVMYLGFAVERMPCVEIHERAQHPYTKALLGANPPDDPDDRRPLTVLQGDIPSPYAKPVGCPFAGRCPLVMDKCRREMPPLETKRAGHPVACWAVE